MSSTPETDPLVEVFRQLRPAVHNWLARDLTTNTSLDTTRAYADLTFAFGFARAAALLPADGACERIREWVDALPTIPNRWTTAQYYSRSHLEFVDAVVLAFPRVGDF
ncbi:MAG: hypothetical protein ACKODX_10575 [Gemmata sp.]